MPFAQARSYRAVREPLAHRIHRLASNESMLSETISLILVSILFLLTPSTRQWQRSGLSMSSSCIAVRSLVVVSG